MTPLRRAQPAIEIGRAAATAAPEANGQSNTWRQCSLPFRPFFIAKISPRKNPQHEIPDFIGCH
jgi:hypothetical protein